MIVPRHLFKRHRIAVRVCCRTAKIESFVAAKKYDPNLDLHEYADNLYQDVGEVALTLIQLRYKQAERRIQALLDLKDL